MALKLCSGFLSGKVVEEICRVLEEEESAEEEQGVAAESMEEFAREMKGSRPDVGTFAVKLRAMVWTDPLLIAQAFEEDTLNNEFIAKMNS